MADKSRKKRTGLNAEQRARRWQQVMFIALAVIVIVSMLLMATAR